MDGLIKGVSADFISFDYYNHFDLYISNYEGSPANAANQNLYFLPFLLL